jgi:hypothetical protein
VFDRCRSSRALLELLVTLLNETVIAEPRAVASGFLHSMLLKSHEAIVNCSKETRRVPDPA